MVETEPFAKPSWHHRTPHLWRRILRGGLRDLVALVVVVGVGEVTARWLLREYSSPFVFTETLTGGHRKQVNSRGLRGREFPTARPPGEIRVLCVGNSTTQGEGVAVEDTYPNQLESLMNRRAGQASCFVINAGGRGKSMIHAVSFLQDEGLSFDPSVVVVGVSPSMLAVLASEQAAVVQSQLKEQRKRPPSMAARFARAARVRARRAHGKLYGSYFYVSWNATVRREAYRFGVLRDRMDQTEGAIFSYGFDVAGVLLGEVEVSYQLLYECIEQIKSLLEARDVGFVVLGIPSRFRISDAAVDNLRGLNRDKIRIEPLDRVGAFCESLGIAFVDLRKRLGAQRESMLDGSRAWDDLYTPLDYTHLNGRGLGLAAEELLKAIESNGWLSSV